MRRVLIIGAGESGLTLLQILDDLWPPPFFMVGLIDDDPIRSGNVSGITRCWEAANACWRSPPRESRSTDLIFAITGEMAG